MITDSLPDDLPEVDPDDVPPFVTDDDELVRWKLSMMIATEIAERPDVMLARVIYFDPTIATTPNAPAPAGLQEDWTDEDRDKALLTRREHAKIRLAQMSPEELERYNQPATKGPTAQYLLGAKYDTTEVYRSTDRHGPSELRYTADRLNTVHQPVIDAIVGDHKAQERPHVLVIAGGPASGKSTLLKQHRELLPADAVHIDADQIKEGVAGDHAGIPEYADMAENDDMYAATGVHRESGDIAKKALDAAMDRKANIVIDQTGNHGPGQFQGDLQRLIDRGYRVDVLYRHAPTDVARQQNLERAVMEKRYVPTPILTESHIFVAQRYRDEIQNMPGLASVTVHDGRQVLAQRNGDGPMDIREPTEYAKWMSKADETLPTNIPERPSIQEASYDALPGIVEAQPWELGDFVRSREDVVMPDDDTPDPDS